MVPTRTRVTRRPFRAFAKPQTRPPCGSCFRGAPARCRREGESSIAGGTGWLALEPTGVRQHQRCARETFPQTNLFRLRRPGRVQSDSTGATLRQSRDPGPHDADIRMDIRHQCGTGGTFCRLHPDRGALFEWLVHGWARLFLVLLVPTSWLTQVSVISAVLGCSCARISSAGKRAGL